MEGPVEEITGTEVGDALKDKKMRKAGGTLRYYYRLLEIFGRCRDSVASRY